MKHKKIKDYPQITQMAQRKPEPILFPSFI